MLWQIKWWSLGRTDNLSWNNLPTTLCLMPKISSLKSWIFFTLFIYKSWSSKGRWIAYNIISNQCTFIINLFGVSLIYFLTWQINNSEGKKLQKVAKRHNYLLFFNVLIFIESASYVRYYIMHCSLQRILFFPNKFLNND